MPLIKTAKSATAGARIGDPCSAWDDCRGLLNCIRHNRFLARTWRSPGGTGGSRRLTHGPIRWSALIRGDRGAGHSGKARNEVSATIRPAKRAGSSGLSGLALVAREVRTQLPCRG
jgi:hypothetical protein